MIQANKKGALPITNGTALSQAAIETHVFPQLQSPSLVSIGQLCDDNCVAILDKKEMNVYKNKQLIVKGHQNPSDGLWDIPLHPSCPVAACPPISSPAPFQPVSNAIFHRNKTHTELAQYHHTTAGSLPIETFFTAISKSNFFSWPGIKLLWRKDLPEPKATIQDHLDQERKNLQLTQPSQRTDATPAIPAGPPKKNKNATC